MVLFSAAACIAAMASLPAAAEIESKASMKKTAPPGPGCAGLTEEELKRRLSAEQFRVLRENGTEKPFANRYWDSHRPGIYVDPISGAPLFSSRDKFDSGTGWPSFAAPIEPSAVAEKGDFSLGMARTEVRSPSSNSHLGHVFDDGPKPGGRRYCINSAALDFIPAEDLAARGYHRYLEHFKTAQRQPLQREVAIFGAGCFWGVEAAFRKVPGVIDTEVGYSGGGAPDPSYEQVCSDLTGHAEVVRVQYDPGRVSYSDLLELFWRIHDPTTPDRQGPDVGRQYRSIIFFHNPEQEIEARASRDRALAENRFRRPIVTEILPAAPFYRAEEHHQRYLERAKLR